MKRHPIDAVALVAGVAFVAAGLMAMTTGVHWVNELGRWVVPVVLLMIGLGGLGASLRRTKDAGETDV